MTTGKGTPTTPAVRRSERLLERQKIPSPAVRRKSERLGKVTPTTPAVRRRSERLLERQKIPSPAVRRKSERLGKVTPTTPVVRRRSERLLERQKIPSPAVRRKSERLRKVTPTTPTFTRKSERLLERQKIPSPAVRRKSERLGKVTPTTPAFTRKSERLLERQKIASPLRRSGRKRNSSSSPSDSKSSESLRSKKKQKKEKSVTQLTLESKEIRKNEELDLGTSPVSAKRIRKPKKDCRTELNRIDKPNQDDDSSTQRSRKRVHYFDGSVHGPDLVSEGIAKKPRKVGNNIVFQPSSKSEVEKLSTGIKAGTSGDLVGNVSQFLPSSTICVGNPFHVNHSPVSICLLDQMSDRPQGDDVESEKRSRLHATHIQEAGDCNGSNNSFTQNSPLSDERIANGSIMSVLDKKAHFGMPGTSNGTDCPGKVTAVDHPSSMEQISEGSIDVPVLDSVLSSRPYQSASPSISLATVSLLNPPLEQQISDGVFLSIPNGDIPVIVPENSHAVANCYNDIETLMKPMLLDGSTTSDQQEGVRRTMIEQNTADATEPLEQMLQLSSLESPPSQNTAGEMQNSSEQVELVSSPITGLPTNQSDHVSLITNPSEQVQQFPCAELPSFNLDPSNFHLATKVEHQPINEVNLLSHDPEASTVVPNQDVVQPDSALEHDSHLFVHPDTRHLSTPMQTAIHSDYRMLPHLCYDPLEIELQRMQKVEEKIMDEHEQKKLQLKSGFEKELDELHRKYDIKSQEIEGEFLQTKTTLDTNRNTVLLNKFLADAFRSKCLGERFKF